MCIRFPCISLQLDHGCYWKLQHLRNFKFLLRFRIISETVLNFISRYNVFKYFEVFRFLTMKSFKEQLKSRRCVQDHSHCNYHVIYYKLVAHTSTTVITWTALSLYQNRFTQSIINGWGTSQFWTNKVAINATACPTWIVIWNKLSFIDGVAIGIHTCIICAQWNHIWIKTNS